MIKLIISLRHEVQVKYKEGNIPLALGRKIQLEREITSIAITL